MRRDGADVIVQLASVTLGAGKPLLPRRIEYGGFVCARFSVARRRA